MTLAINGGSTLECGDEVKTQFTFANGYTNLNHGSFGAIPDTIRLLQRSYQDQADSQPDIFIRYAFPSLLSRNRQAIASFVSASKSDIVFVPNATTGINTILRNLIFEPGDTCIYFSTIYGSMERLLYYISEITPLRLHKITLTYPISDADVLSSFTSAIELVRRSGARPRIAIFDTISSVPGVRVPFEGLTGVCRQEEVLSIVDGAQGVGQLHLDLGKLDADFFVSNLHKWLFVPRPCAVLYVAKRHQHLIRSSLPTSHGFIPKNAKDVNNPLPASDDMTEFEGNFEFTGTADSSAFVCVEAALRWRSTISWKDFQGEDAIVRYLRHSAFEAGRIFSEVLQTEVMQDRESAIGDCAFVNIRLPIEYQQIHDRDIEFNKVLAIARRIEKTIVERHNTFVLVFWHDGKYWTRLSAQLYLTAEDWNKAAHWLKSVCSDVMHSNILER